MMKMTTRFGFRLPVRSLIAVAATLWLSGAAFAASLSVTSARVQEAGDTARICVGLTSGGEDVAATQNELVWDANCASLVDKCEANSAHGKQLMSNQRGNNALRAIIISLQDTNKIPDGELYCCTFRAEVSSGGSCCAIGLQGMSASDPEGRALSLAGRGGQICRASGSTSSGGLQGGTGQPPAVGTDLGTGSQPQGGPGVAGQPGQAAAPNAAGSGNTVASGGTGGVQGGTGGVPGGVGGVPGGGAPAGAPGAVPPQPGQAPQAQAPVAGAEQPAAGAARPQQAPAAGAQQDVAQGQAPAANVPAQAEAAPTKAAAAPATARPAAPAKPAEKAPAVATKVVPAAAAKETGSGCNCEINPGGGIGFEGSSALVAIGLLLWARRRKI